MKSPRWTRRAITVFVIALPLLVACFWGISTTRSDTIEYRSASFLTPVPNTPTHRAQMTRLLFVASSDGGLIFFSGLVGQAPHEDSQWSWLVGSPFGIYSEEQEAELHTHARWRTATDEQLIGFRVHIRRYPSGFEDVTVRVPYWFVLILTAIPGAVLIYRAQCFRLRSRRGLCAGCGYEMRGISTGVCPECGQASAKV